MRNILWILPLVACGGSDDPCGNDVQWAPFSTQEFATLCEGDTLTIREFNPGEYLVDLNVQFQGIDGEAAVAGEWSLRFDGELSTTDLVSEVASFEDGGWYRVHTMLWLGQTTTDQVDALDGTTATLEARFSDPSGDSVSGTLDLITAAP
ncbi:MAG: hypothetical protein EP330_27590 [Deltaproteobacteria bacterium]|nr:MAG: hypothetical protein EP330_27590 [Deltaproteobacteria bacterium]